MLLSEARLSNFFGSAISLVTPTINAMMNAKIAKRHDLHIVAGLKRTTPSGTVLVENSLGNETAWEHDYRTIARQKFELTARTGLSTREVHLMKPHLLEEGDVLYWGSYIREGLIVACSGVQSYFDELFSLMIVETTIRMLENFQQEVRVLSSKVGDVFVIDF